MRKMLTTIMGTSSLLFALNSYAQTEYDYLDINFNALEIDFESLQLKADGYSIAFTKDYRDRFLLLAGFKRYLFDEHDLYRMRQDTYNIGIGLHMALLLDGNSSAPSVNAGDYSARVPRPKNA